MAGDKVLVFSQSLLSLDDGDILGRIGIDLVMTSLLPTTSGVVDVLLKLGKGVDASPLLDQFGLVAALARFLNDVLGIVQQEKSLFCKNQVK